MLEFTIDPEFYGLIPPLTNDEYRQLEANIIQYGCQDPLKIWREEGILIDGHNRYWICTEHSIPFCVHHIALPSRQATIDWIINNQLGRRNLTRDQMAYMRGKQYHALKTNGHGVKSVYQNDTQNTRQMLANQYRVGEQTIARNAAYATAIDLIEDLTNQDVAQEILRGGIRLSQNEVMEFEREYNSGDDNRQTEAIAILNTIIACNVGSIKVARRIVNNKNGSKRCPNCGGTGYVKKEENER